MEAIADFFSKNDEIERLNKQLSMVAKFYDDFYKSEIRQLKSKFGKKTNKSRSERKNKALLLIMKLKGTGKPVDLIRIVAKECFLTEKRANSLWYGAK